MIHRHYENLPDGRSVQVNLTTEGLIVDAFDESGDSAGTQSSTFEELYDQVAQFANHSEPFQTWLRRGIDAGWISEPYRAMHDIGPMTEDETTDFDAGGDPCTTNVRVWGDDR